MKAEDKYPYYESPDWPFEKCSKELLILNKIGQNFINVGENFKAYMASQKDFRNPVLGIHAINILNAGCSTIACVGGWYLLSRFNKDEIELETNGLYVEKKTGFALNYSEGADAMSIDLGFNGQLGLCNWARDYPSLWGNDQGFGVFSSRYAYVADAVVENISVQDVCDWLIDVGHRCIKVQQQRDGV